MNTTEEILTKILEKLEETRRQQYLLDSSTDISIMSGEISDIRKELEEIKKLLKDR